MRFEILLAPEAVQDFRRLDAHTRAEVQDALEIHLRHEPTRISRSRIKRLRGLARPQFRLRVGEVRVFYDVGRGRPSPSHRGEIARFCVAGRIGRTE